MLVYVDTHLLCFFGDAEGHTALTQDQGNQQGSPRSQAIGHEYSLKLPKHQRKSPLFGEHGTSWMAFDQG